MAFAQSEVDKLLVDTGRSCCICGTLHAVQVHHIVHIKDGGSDSIENGIPLCPTCHSIVHKEYSPGSSVRSYTPGELRHFRTRALEANRRRWLGLAVQSEVLAVHDHFPIRQVAQALGNAQWRVLVWHTWTEYFDEILFLHLVKFFRTAHEAFPLQEIKCRVLLAHPEDSFCAKYRARALANSDLGPLVRRAASNFARAARKVSRREFEELLEIRLYSSVLTMPLYIIDNRAFVGWYPDGETSHYAPYIEIDATHSGLVTALESSWIRTWDKAQWEWNFRRRRPEPVRHQNRRELIGPGV
jgi:hypothetical protein